MSVDAGPAPNLSLREMRDLAGPRGLPLLGNLLQIDKPLVHAQVEAWGRRYGPLFRIRLGRTDLLVVDRPCGDGAVLRDRPEGFRRTPRLARVWPARWGSPAASSAPRATPGGGSGAW